MQVETAIDSGNRLVCVITKCGDSGWVTKNELAVDQPTLQSHQCTLVLFSCEVSYG